MPSYNVFLEKVVHSSQLKYVTNHYKKIDISASGINNWNYLLSSSYDSIIWKTFINGNFCPATLAIVFRFIVEKCEMQGWKFRLLNNDLPSLNRTEQRLKSSEKVRYASLGLGKKKIICWCIVSMREQKKPPIVFSINITLVVLRKRFKSTVQILRLWWGVLHHREMVGLQWGKFGVKKNNQFSVSQFYHSIRKKWNTITRNNRQHMSPG